nr:MAG TPA: minor capsid protein [Caudoviricetes sp.]
MADYGHQETDKRLEVMEKRISKVYADTLEEAKNKLTAVLKEFQEEDKKRAQLVADGKLKQRAYVAWRQELLGKAKHLQDMIDVLTEDFTNADKIAMSIVSGEAAGVYALNANYAAYEIEQKAGINLSWTLYDHSTVERLISEEPDLLPLPSVNIPLDQQWNKKHITAAINRGILLGDPIPDIAQRLLNVANMDLNAAIRSARTATTAAECAGRIDTYKYAESIGIEMQQEWVATLDDRTRHEHRILDGQRIDIGEAFEVDGATIRYPGDPQAPGYLVYNCRCTLVSAVKGIDQSGAARRSKLGNMSYEDWKAGKDQKSVEYSAKSGIITGRIGNISTKIPVDKFTKYSLNQERQPDKAKAFESALGYTSKNVDALIANIQQNLKEEEFVEKGNSGHGMRYENIVVLTGANGKTANVLTAWIEDNGDRRLTSVYVTKRGKRK